jgi:hypothetical protein
MRDNLLFLDFVVSKSNILSFLKPHMAEFMKAPIPLEDYSVQLFIDDQNNPLQLSGHLQKLFVKLPIGFTIIKEDGLFGLQGSGSLSMDLVIECTINGQFYMTTKTELIDYDWIEKPQIQVGSLSMPAETIADCVIKNVKGDICTKLDSAIAQNVDLRSMLMEQLNEIPQNSKINSKPDLFFNFELLSIQTNGLRDDAGKLSIHMWAEIAGKVSDELVILNQSHDPSFHWIETEPKNVSQDVEIQLSYAGLAKLIKENVNGQEFGGKRFDIDTIHIRHTSNLEIKASIFEPVKGIATITGRPSFDTVKQSINITDLDVDIDAANIIYKMSSPIIEKIVETKLMQLLPIEIQPFIQKYVKKPQPISLLNDMIKLQPSFSTVTISNIEWGQSHVNIIVSASNAEVDVEV